MPGMQFPTIPVWYRYGSMVSRARGREVDIAIAAHAIVRQCSLWTLNAEDFEDLPGLRLYLPA